MLLVLNPALLYAHPGRCRQQGQGRRWFGRSNHAVAGAQPQPQRRAPRRGQPWADAYAVAAAPSGRQRAAGEGAGHHGPLGWAHDRRCKAHSSRKAIWLSPTSAWPERAHERAPQAAAPPLIRLGVASPKPMGKGRWRFRRPKAWIWTLSVGTCRHQASSGSAIHGHEHAGSVRSAHQRRVLLPGRARRA